MIQHYILANMITGRILVVFFRCSQKALDSEANLVEKEAIKFLNGVN